MCWHGTDEASLQKYRRWLREIEQDQLGWGFGKPREWVINAVAGEPTQRALLALEERDAKIAQAQRELAAIEELKAKASRPWWETDEPMKVKELA